MPIRLMSVIGSEGGLVNRRRHHWRYSALPVAHYGDDGEHRLYLRTNFDPAIATG